MLRRIFALALLPALLPAGAAAAAIDWAALSRAVPAASPAPAGATFIVTGHGWGHGVGMPQWGAYGYAQHGWGYARILAHYYPGTSLGPAPVAKVRVLLADGKSSLIVSSAAPFKVKDGKGADHAVPAGKITFGPGLKLKLDPDKPAKALPGPLVFSPGTAPLQLGRRYRGSIQVDVSGGALRAINVVPLEAYLYGVVPAEMPHSWSPEALKCQAVVARSYALAVRKTGPFDLYADTRSQMYLGIDHEYASSNAAVDATAGQVLLYGGQVAVTYFFSSSGGRTANVTDVWPGGKPVPYLVSVADPYDTISPYHNWGPFVFSAAKLGRVLHVPGRLLDAQATLNSSGRSQALVATGTGGKVTVAAADVRSALGLRSTWFTLGELALAPPARPTVVFGSAVQLTGIARGVDRVALEQRSGSTAWGPVAPVSPGKDGAVAVNAKPAATTQYRLATGTVAASGPVRVAVAPALRFFVSDDTTSLRGTERPLLPGTRIQIQRLVGGKYRNVQTLPVDANGAFQTKLPSVAGTYRARYAPGHGFVAATSQPVKVLAA